MSERGEEEKTIKRETRSRRPFRQTIGALLVLACGGAACTNSNSLTISSITTGGTLNSTTTSSSTKLKISSVTIGASASSSTTSSTSSTSYLAKIYFSASNSTTISSYCSVSSSTSSSNSAPCSCRFQWEEVNTVTGDSVGITRTVDTSVSAVQSSYVNCNAPSVYSSEISDDALIKISVVAASGNGNSFTVEPYSYSKSGATATGSFTDSEGRAFDNIHRYTCFEQFQRGMSVTSKYFTTTSTSTTGAASGKTVNVSYASQFCVAKADGSGASSGTGCSSATPENSAQAYYYNLFIRNTDRGGVNEQNTRYVCPRVKEALNTAGTVGSEGQYWPMDTTFALALTPSTDFPVGVEGPSRLAIGGDSSTQSSSCSGTGTTSSSGDSGNSSILSSCLGFAAKPASDGTCSYFTDSNGIKRFTYRLRRFYAVYPPTYDTNGKGVSQAPAIDMIYVLDRPVNSANADPTKPFTMRGPKPCPFSFFDHKGVLGDASDPLYSGGMPSYAATNYSGWTGVNVDGIQFPNKDDYNTMSCSAVMPLYNSSTNMLSLGTLNASNPARKIAYIRPIRAWAPHYEEDTSFEACAPQPSTLVDPPLHFAKDTSTGNVAWCAEAYPTQNSNVTQLDVRSGGSGAYPGYVMNYTSHIVKQSRSSTCTATSITVPSSSDYPAKPSGSCPTVSATTVPTTYAAAHHPATVIIDSRIKSSASSSSDTEYQCADKTCDRTVSNSGLTWAKFPLLARAPQVEAAISADTTYGCMISYDNDLGKKGKSTPSGGCCGTNVSVTTSTSTSGINYTNAHLEPDVPCLTPTY